MWRVEMKALSVDQNGKLEVCDVPKPVYGDCQALVKTLSCGVCNGTDMKLIHGSFKNMTHYPMLLGHEAVGQVVEKGKYVTSFEIGDIVLLPFLYGDVGKYSSGWGAYAEYGIVGDAKAYISHGMGPGTKEFDDSFYAQTVIKPEYGLTAVEASMIVTFREVLSAIRRFGFQANQDVVIFGAGPVGLCFTRFCKLLGMRTVITIDISDDKTEQACNMGADIVINSSKEDVEAMVLKYLPEGADYVVDAVGINQLLNQGMRLIKYNGKVCGYGISPKLGMDLDWSDAPYNWQLHFVQFPRKKEEAEAHSQIMAWIAAGALKPSDFISNVFEFDHILDAFGLVEKRLPDTKKVVIRYS